MMIHVLLQGIRDRKRVREKGDPRMEMHTNKQTNTHTDTRTHTVVE
jgi:hypothetical protein